MMKIAITCGDPAGIGPELLLQWAGHPPASPSSFVLVGPRSWVEQMKERGDFDSAIVGPADFAARPGSPSDAGARVAREALEVAAEGCGSGVFDAVATGPVSKEWMSRAGFRFPGQTEFFAAAWGGDPVMGFCGGRLKLTLATWHVPLAEVPATLDAEKLGRAVRCAAELAALENVNAPRIAVCGLNPHAGEGGILGREEVDWIDPMLDRMRNDFPGLSRTLPADTVFRRMLQGEYDVAVALYHDQGLVPLKTLEFEQAVNVTLGLSGLRTSPDHGTAFDLAGHGTASPASFSRAIELACRWAGKTGGNKNGGNKPRRT